MNVLKQNIPFGRRQIGRSLFCAPSPKIIESERKVVEARHSAREHLWCVCYIHSNLAGQEDTREGIMLDLSDTGARIRSRNRQRFPDEVILKAPRLGLRIRARKVWQKGFDTGVTFTR